MLVDGICCSSALDRSSEIINIEKMDISDLQSGIGPMTWEHRNDKSAGASANDIVGKIVYAKKILKASDCENDRQTLYWNKVKLPFVYFIGRIFDEAGHLGSMALAAIFRDAAKHKEPVYIVRYSIEGVTLSRKDNIIEECIAKKVTVTVAPCNTSCLSGVIFDNNPPPGFEQYPEESKQRVRDILDGIVEIETKKSDEFDRIIDRLGEPTTMPWSPILDISLLNKNEKSLIKTFIKLASLKKAMILKKGKEEPGISNDNTKNLKGRPPANIAASPPKMEASPLLNSRVDTNRFAPKKPSKHLGSMPEHYDSQPLKDVLAYSENATDPDHLKAMSEHPNDYVQSNVAWNPNTHPDVLGKLASNKGLSNVAALHLAWNPKTPHSALDQLKSHPHPDVSSRVKNRLQGVLENTPKPYVHLQPEGGTDDYESVQVIKPNRHDNDLVDWMVARDAAKAAAKSEKLSYFKFKLLRKSIEQITDKIPGGLADKKNPEDFDPESLAEGIKVELEHTSDKSIATEIAMDHLTEDKLYYKKLKVMESKGLNKVDMGSSGGLTARHQPSLAGNNGAAQHFSVHGANDEHIGYGIRHDTPQGSTTQAFPKIGFEHHTGAIHDLTAKTPLGKSTTAGMGGAAPSELTGDAALQIEDNPKNRKKNQLLSIFRDYGKSVTDPADFKKFLKHKLPEASDDYVEYFTEIAHNASLKFKKHANENIFKFESLLIDLKKSIDEFQAEPEELAPRTVSFAGHTVIPGYCETGDGKYYHLLHEDFDRFVGVPIELDLNWEAEDLLSLDKIDQGKKYKVYQKPVFVINSCPFTFGE